MPNGNAGFLLLLKSHNKVVPLEIKLFSGKQSRSVAGNFGRKIITEYATCFSLLTERLLEKRNPTLVTISDILRALPVVCGLGKSGLISDIYPEQFELRSSLFDGFKTSQIPLSTNYRYRGVQKD